jgi:hypothetical protein
VPTVSVLLNSTESSFKYAGEVIHYTMTVKNTGAVAVSNLQHLVGQRHGRHVQQHHHHAGQHRARVRRRAPSSPATSVRVWRSPPRPRVQHLLGWSATQTDYHSVGFVPEQKLSVTTFTASPSPSPPSVRR